MQNQISTMTNHVQYSKHASLTISHFFESNEEISSRERLFTQVCSFFFQKAVLLPHEDDAIVFKSLRDFFLPSEAQLKDNKSSNIYYMELIDENADSMETMSQVAEMVQQKLIGTAQQQFILVGDGKTYQHLQQSKRVYGDALKDILIFPGDWHILKNFQQVLMKQYYHVGLKDIASNSGFRAETLSSLERCSNFKRTHNFLLQAWESLFLEMVESFINENTSLATTQVKEQIKVMFEANNDEPIQYLLNVQSILNEDVLVVFHHFIKNQASIDDTWKIWMHFVFEDFFSYFCLYISIRTSNWKLRMSSLKNIAPLFTAYDRPCYQRLLPDHIADVQCYPEIILRALEGGAFTVKVSPGLGHAIALDEAHEMCVNKDMKMSVVRPTLPYLKKTLHFHSYRIKAHKQFLSELFPVTISNEDITSIVDNSTVNKKVEENIRKMRSLISASNLFYTTTDNRGLVNTFNGEVASNEQSHDLINARKMGQKDYENYVSHYILKQPSVSNAPVRRRRLLTMAPTMKKKSKKITPEEKEEREVNKCLRRRLV